LFEKSGNLEFPGKLNTFPRFLIARHFAGLFFTIIIRGYWKMETQTMDDFVPSELLKRTFHRWWLLVIFMIVGGATGILFSQLQKPIYESQASITTSIDFAYANRLNEDEEDYLILTIGDVIGSSGVFDSVKQLAAEIDITITDETLKTAFTKARQGYRWELTVRDSNPETAQTLTQLWVETADKALADFRERNLDTLKYQSAELAIQNCFSQIVVIEPASAYCSLGNLTEIRNDLEETSTQVKVDSLSNAILLSKISSEITDNAYLPGSPTVFKRNILALAGCICFRKA
jgi:hypothetical protein